MASQSVWKQQYVSLALSSLHQNWNPVSGRFSQIFKTRFLVQTLISQGNINQIKRFIDQNLSWLILNRKHFQCWKSKILFSCHTPLNSDPLLLTQYHSANIFWYIFRINIISHFCSDNFWRFVVSQLFKKTTEILDPNFSRTALNSPVAPAAFEFFTALSTAVPF